jgi:hypothetical protein
MEMFSDQDIQMKLRWLLLIYCKECAGIQGRNSKYSRAKMPLNQWDNAAFSEVLAKPQARARSRNFY